jgi:NAD(P)-dependent dehydrogenase (short-subunit alcohol dehydrogenase family)
MSLPEPATAEFPLPYASAELTGQVALVTGATSGLGRRFARTLAAAGADVVAAGRRVDRLDEVVAEIQHDGRGRAAAVELDVTDAASIAAVVDRAEATFGTVTVLVNNAGIPDAQRAHKMPLELVDRVIDTNLRGPYLLACEVARRLIAAGRPGRIVNISSMGAYSYEGGAAALYSITKAAINRMTEALAVEWVRYGINVNGIAPGAFSSEMMDGMMSRIGDFTQALPRKRLGDPAQLDSTLLYLVAPSSEFVTGTVVKVDDGQGPR